MSLTEVAILSVLSSLPVFHEDVGSSDKSSQLEEVASAVYQTSIRVRWGGDRRELAALLLTIAWHETRLSLRIHAGDCKPLECDRGRSLSLFQLQARSLSNPVFWPALRVRTPESTLFSALEAGRALSRSRNLCRSLYRSGDDWVPYTLGAYAGRGCSRSLPDMDARVSTYRRVRIRLDSADRS